MSRRNLLLSAVIGLILIVFTLFLLFYNRFLSREEPRVYNVTIETSDVRIKDIEFVTFPKFIYTTDHDLEVIGAEKEFLGISYVISVHGKQILSVSQADNPFTLPDAYQGKISYDTRNLLQGINIDNDDKLNIEIRYEVDGEQKNLFREIDIKQILKPYSSTDSGNVIKM